MKQMTIAEWMADPALAKKRGSFRPERIPPFWQVLRGFSPGGNVVLRQITLGLTTDEIGELTVGVQEIIHAPSETIWVDTDGADIQESDLESV